MKALQIAIAASMLITQVIWATPLCGKVSSLDSYAHDPSQSVGHLNVGGQDVKLRGIGFNSAVQAYATDSYLCACLVGNLPALNFYKVARSLEEAQKVDKNICSP
jgi:hypothetical protein